MYICFSFQIQWRRSWIYFLRKSLVCSEVVTDINLSFSFVKKKISPNFKLLWIKFSFVCYKKIRYFVYIFLLISSLYQKENFLCFCCYSSSFRKERYARFFLKNIDFQITVNLFIFQFLHQALFKGNMSSMISIDWVKLMYVISLLSDGGTKAQI